MPTYTVTVNHTPHSIEVQAGTPLLWVLRDTLGLTGTKFGCGKGLCGSCTVLIDGDATKSCSVPIEHIGSKGITTIEGLVADRRHPVPKAWLEEEVPQCGYCQSGQIMTAAALLSRNANPTEDDIDNAMSGVLCRCGTYQRIRRAIHRAAKEVNVR